MDSKTILATLTRAMLASIAGALVHHGVMQSSGTEAFIGAGMLAATGAWGLWNGYGKDIAKASLDILRARVLAAAARAQATPALAPQALASVAAHVEATTPEAAPASPGGAQTALMLALALSALALAWAGPAGAQGVPRLTGNPAKDFAPKPSASVTTPSGALNYDSLGQQFQALVKDVIDKAILDLTAASKDAGGQVPPDLISQPCWDAQVAFLRLLPAEWAEPPKDVGPALAIQIGRDLRRALTGDQKGTIKVDCAALFGDELAQVGKLGSLVGLKALTGGLAP